MLKLFEYYCYGVIPDPIGHLSANYVAGAHISISPVFDDIQLQSPEKHSALSKTLTRLPVTNIGNCVGMRTSPPYCYSALPRHLKLMQLKFKLRREFTMTMTRHAAQQLEKKFAMCATPVSHLESSGVPVPVHLCRTRSVWILNSQPPRHLSTAVQPTQTCLWRPNPATPGE